MTNSPKMVVLERIGKNKDIIKIKFTQNITPAQSISYLISAISTCFQHGFSQIVLDMGHIDVSHKDFTATLIEATSKVRKKDGDIKLINLSEKAKLILDSFNAYSFLSIET